MSEADTVLIKPAPGRRVRDVNNQVVPEAGIDVTLLPALPPRPGHPVPAIDERLPSFWRRRLDDRDITIEQRTNTEET